MHEDYVSAVTIYNNDNKKAHTMMTKQASMKRKLTNGYHNIMDCAYALLVGGRCVHSFISFPWLVRVCSLSLRYLYILCLF